MKWIVFGLVMILQPMVCSAQTGSVCGYVKTREGKAAVNTIVEVYVAGKKIDSTLTNKDGDYMFADLPEAMCTVAFEYGGRPS